MTARKAIVRRAATVRVAMVIVVVVVVAVAATAARAANAAKARRKTRNNLRSHPIKQRPLRKRGGLLFCGGGLAGGDKVPARPQPRGPQRAASMREESAGKTLRATGGATAMAIAPRTAAMAKPRIEIIGRTLSLRPAPSWPRHSSGALR